SRLNSAENVRRCLLIRHLSHGEDSRLNRCPGSVDHYKVFVDTPLSECERRDPKGLYRKARSGKIENFTGIDSIYEAPAQPDITIDTLSEDPNLAVKRIISYLETNQPA
ncbi:adenylyl-sulfate kinase, partial [Pseudomonas aeruginosa]|uniref:adenylyl-sulfate kinase n=1 Tax=Pseudomonas aeruginosa TaxID=287 RepID=UPI001F25017E